ncbi:MAG: T9SS type A sorting domain-containing protein [Ignavibacteriaceae bacterium]
MLEQNYPNPFNPTTKIKYQIPVVGLVLVQVYNMLAEVVTTLVNEEKPIGSHEVDFNATSFPSGIYFYKLQVYPVNGGAGSPSKSSGQSFVETKKMVLLR